MKQAVLKWDSAVKSRKQGFNMKYLRTLIQKVQKRFGWDMCPCCRNWRRIKIVQDPVVFEEEPPMFFHYECTGCGARTVTLPTSLTEDALKELGYSSYDAFLEELKEKGDSEQIKTEEHDPDETY